MTRLFVFAARPLVYAAALFAAEYNRVWLDARDDVWEDARRRANPGRTPPAESPSRSQSLSQTVTAGLMGVDEARKMEGMK